VELPIIYPEYTQICRNSKNHVIEFESDETIEKSIKSSPKKESEPITIITNIEDADTSEQLDKVGDLNQPAREYSIKELT
jgi:DNA-binding transcriptional regulator WhiA